MLFAIVFRTLALGAALCLPPGDEPVSVTTLKPVVLQAEQTSVYLLGPTGVRLLDDQAALRNPAEWIEGPGELLLVCQGLEGAAPHVAREEAAIACRGDIRLVGLDFSARASRVECRRAAGGDWNVRLSAEGADVAELWQASFTEAEPLHMAAPAIRYTPAARRIELERASFMPYELPAEAQWKLRQSGW